jgi:molecular chaperone GrpE
MKAENGKRKEPAARNPGPAPAPSPASGEAAAPPAGGAAPPAESAPAPGGEPAPACAEPDLSKLTADDLKDLLKKAREREEFLDRLRCLQADAENYRKRLARESARHRLWGIREIALEVLLPAIDNLERALRAPSETAEAGAAIRLGVERVLGMAREGMTRKGLKPIEALGRSFDPAVHEALAEIPRADVKPGTVVEEVQKGYVLEDLVVRPAKVVISKAAPPAAAKPDAPPGGGKGGPA